MVENEEKLDEIEKSGGRDKPCRRQFILLWSQTIYKKIGDNS